MLQNLIAVGAAVVLLSPCPGQPGKQEPVKVKPVVVTARKWEELHFDVPQSVSAISAEQIRDAGLDSVKEAARYIPNVMITEFSSRRLSFPFVRGIGSGQGDPAVATFIDGVPQLQVSSTNLPFLDVDRVEFLRGPSGALYGRNTLGGAINVITKWPSNTTEYGGGVTIGNFDLHDYRFSFSTPLEEEKLYLSVSGLKSERDGYTKNDFTGHDVDFRDSWFGRAQLLWIPDPTNELRLAVHGENANDGGFVLSDLAGLRSRPNRINQDFEGRTDRDLVATSLTWNHHGDHTELTSITAVQRWEIEETADFDFSTIDGIRRKTQADETAISQELRLASPEDDDLEVADNVAMRWLIGVSGFFSEADETAANDFRPGGVGILFPAAAVGVDRASGDFDSYSVAAFGQATLTIDDWIDVTGALRWEYESKNADIDRTFTSSGVTVPTASSGPSENFDELLPRASVALWWSEQVMTYGLVARGFKAGGFNLTAPTGSETFRTEKSWNYEVGVRTSCCEDRVTISAAAFYIDWDDMQLTQFDTASGGYVVNAGESDSSGVELEIAGKATDELQLFGGIGVLDTEFDEFVDQFGQNNSGQELPFAPDWTANVGAQFTADVSEDLQLFARAEYFYVGTFHYDAGNIGSENYDLANLRIGCGGKNWRVDAWLNNAFDENYVPVAFQPNPADPTQFVGESAAPRTYGVTVRVTF
ncbi:MAG: TonB-dependent receptor [Planctomycetota bacterium]|jgi:iron complex outermembrane receptor protein